MFDLLRTPMNRTCVLLLPSVGKGNDTHHTGHIDGVLAPFIERTDFVPLLVFVLCRRLGFFSGSDLRRRRGPNHGKECNQTPGVDRMTGPFTNGALVRLVGNHYCCTQPSVQGNHASNVQEVSPCFVHGAVRLLVVFGFLIVVVNTHDVACMYMLYAESAELLYASILFATVGSVRIRNLLLGMMMVTRRMRCLTGWWQMVAASCSFWIFSTALINANPQEIETRVALFCATENRVTILEHVLSTSHTVSSSLSFFVDIGLFRRHRPS